MVCKDARNSKQLFCNVQRWAIALRPIDQLRLRHVSERNDKAKSSLVVWRRLLLTYLAGNGGYSNQELGAGKIGQPAGDSNSCRRKHLTKSDDWFPFLLRACLVVDPKPCFGLDARSVAKTPKEADARANEAKARKLLAS